VPSGGGSGCLRTSEPVRITRKPYDRCHEEYIHNLADKDGSRVDPTLIGMPADFPQDLRNLVTFEDLGDGKTELTVTEYDWPVGQMMEMSRVGLEQCLNKMAAIFATSTANACRRSPPELSPRV